MNILVVSSGNIVQLNAYARHFVRCGHDVTFINPEFRNALSHRGMKEEFDNTGVTFYTWRDFRTAEVWKQLPFDCTFGTQHGATIEVLRYQAGMRIPTLLQILDIPIALFGDARAGSSLCRKFIPLLTAFPKIWNLTVINSEIREQVRQLYDKYTHVTFYPIDTDLFDHSVSIQSQGDFVLCVSRLASFKRVDLAIRAAKYADKKLVIASDGGERANLERLAGELKADVEFLGFVQDDQKAALLRTCRMHIFTQMAPAMACIPPAEALYCKKPSIVFDYPDQREIDGNFSYYVPPGDWVAMGEMIKWVDTHYDIAEKRAQEANKWVWENLRQEVIADKILKILMQLTGDTER